MKDSTRENLSYFGLFLKMMKVKKEITPEYVSYGSDKDQYLLYYEPPKLISDKVIIWIHGGGWNAGNPKFFDYAGQKVASEGYRMVSLGYRLSPKNKYPAQIEDVCKDKDILLFAVNLMQAVRLAHRCPSRKWKLFAAGLALFFCCDLCVGIHNLPNLGGPALHRFAQFAMWGFYLPGQCLIRASAYPPPRKESVQ